jgi:hypothetical protein
MKKSLEIKEFLSKEPSLTTMQLKLKLSTSEEKLKKPSWLRNLLKKFMREFNTFQLKLKLFTILRGTTTCQPRLRLELSMFKVQPSKAQTFNKQARLKELPIKPTVETKADPELVKHTFQEEAELVCQLQTINLDTKLPLEATQLHPKCQPTADNNTPSNTLLHILLHTKLDMLPTNQLPTKPLLEAMSQGEVE